MASKRERKRGVRRLTAGAWIFCVAVVSATGLYALGFMIYETGPASAFGLGFGIAAAALLVGASLYGIRRRSLRLVSKLRLGSAKRWLSFHIYGSLLYLLLLHMHSGFQVPTGTITWWLWVLSLWIVVSGMIGRAMQLWIPRALGSGLSIEVLYERIPELVDELRSQAETLVATSDESIQTMYSTRVAPLLVAPHRRAIYFVDLSGGMQAQLRDFDYLRTFLPEGERAKLDQLARLFETKLNFDAHYTLQGALRAWLWAHAPVSAALLALLVLHLFSVLYF